MTARTLDVDAVTRLVTRVADTIVAPRFRDLRSGDVREKSPGDVVTVVDTEAEVALVAGLSEIAPGVPVIGEEAAHALPATLDLLGSPRVWVVDPLDGTQAFVDGSPDYAVMVGLVKGGEAVAGWIYLPEHGEMLVAERGAGAFRNGERLRRGAPPSALADLHGGLATRYLPEDVLRRATGFGPGVTSGRQWAGYHYAQVALGREDFLLYWRTWPWDHAPGAVVLREVGGVSRRLDGTEYRPGVVGTSLLAAADDATFRLVSEQLVRGD